MDTIVLGLSLFLAAACAALSVAQFAQVRALRREARAMADALSRLSPPVTLQRTSTARKLSEVRLFELRRTALRIEALQSAEAQRSRGMIQVLKTVRPGEEPPIDLGERNSGFWPTYPKPPERA